MKIIAYVLGFLVYWIVNVVSLNLFGDSGFMFYLGVFLSSAIGGFLSSLVIGKIQAKDDGTMMNFWIPILFFLIIIGGIIGVVQGGFSEIWEYIVSLFGLFVAFGFFNMYVIKNEG